jgi:hypothetical protein
MAVVQELIIASHSQINIWLDGSSAREVVII